MAISAVVSIHTTGPNATAAHARGTKLGLIAIALDIGAIFAVPLFVMLSGATLLDPAKVVAPRDFLRRRAARLLPAVVLWHAWYWVVWLVMFDHALSPHDTLVYSLNGKLAPHLYFFWIVLGLSLVTPVLLPFVREHGRRAALGAGALMALATAATSATPTISGGAVGFTHSAWNWWVPYLGVSFSGTGCGGSRRGELPWRSSASRSSASGRSRPGSGTTLTRPPS